MESLVLLAVPIVVSVLTQGVKKITSIKYSDNKKSILRVFAATASFAGVVLTAWATEGEVDPVQIEVYAETLAAFFATQIPYWLGKQR
jgi:hypothetical protein